MTNNYTRQPKLPPGTEWVRREPNYIYKDELGRDVLMTWREDAVYSADREPVINEDTGKQHKRYPQSYWGTRNTKKPPGARDILYKLPELVREIKQGKDIYIVEGEPKVITLRNMGYAATTAPGGAGNWQPGHGELLRGAKRVIILPDNDDAGRKHADKVGRSLDGVVNKWQCLLLELPNLPEHGDIVDWVKAGGTDEQFAELVAQAREWTAYGPPEEELDIESIEIRPGMVDIYNVKVRDCGIVAVGAEQLNHFPWFNRACIANLQRAFDPPKSLKVWSRQIDTALRTATRIEVPGEALHIHGTESWGDEEVEWTIYERMPRNGVGLLSGPHGIFKTFLLLDLCGSAMTGLSFLNKRVRRRCGVLLFAPEGANTIKQRLRALIEHKLNKENLNPRDLLDLHGIDLENLPFAFVGDCRPLLDPRTVDWMIGRCQHVQEHFKKVHGLDLGLIGIDTMAAAAGWDSENDAAQAQIVMNHMADISAATDTFMLAVDHFGQDISSGTRGSTAKESAASTIFYVRGKSDGDGVFTDTRVVQRKQRAGPQGLVFPFQAREVKLGEDRYGEVITSRVIDWNVTRPQPGKVKPPYLVILEKLMPEALATHGEKVSINGKEVLAIDKVKLRHLYKVAYQDLHRDAKTKAKNNALRRALNAAAKAKTVQSHTVGGVAYLWQAQPPF
jgi:hypothetical protein